MGILGRFLFALICIGIGLFILLASLGKIDLPLSPQVHQALFQEPRHGQIMATGGVLLLAGVVLIFSGFLEGLAKFLGVLCVLAVVAALVSFVVLTFKTV